MGDIADMILEGCMCQGCGEFLGEGEGFPAYCPSCQSDENKAEKALKKAANIEKNARQKKTKCPDCGKKVKEIGLSMHRRDVHSPKLQFK